MFKFLALLPTVLFGTTPQQISLATPPSQQIDTCIIPAHCGVGCIENIKQCIAACSKDCEISFEGQETHIFFRNETNLGLLISNKTNLHITGSLQNLLQKPKILLHGLTSLFTFKDCKNITISNLLFDMFRVPFTEGTVNEINYHSNTFKMLLNNINLYPFPGSINLNDGENYDYLYNVKAINGYDNSKKQFIEPNLILKESNIIDIDTETNIVTVHVDDMDMLNKLKTGQDLVLRHEMDNFNLMNFEGNEDITLSEIEVLASAGNALDFIKNVGITLDNIMIRKGENKPMSVASKGVNMEVNKGDITILDSIFSGIGSKSFNIHNYFFEIKSKINTSAIELTQDGLNDFIQPWINIGDMYEFRDRKTLNIKFNSKLIEFDAASNIAKFADKIPTSKINVNDVITSTNAEPNIVNVVNNIFKESLSIANNIKTKNVNLLNNVYDKVTGPAILLDVDAGKNLESGVTQSGVISNNNITDCNYGLDNKNGSIMITAIVPEFDIKGKLTGNDIPLTSGQVHKTIKINNNYINNGNQLTLLSSKKKEDQDSKSSISIRATRSFYVKQNELILPTVNYPIVQEFNDLIPSVVRDNQCYTVDLMHIPCHTVY